MFTKSNLILICCLFGKVWGTPGNIPGRGNTPQRKKAANPEGVTNKIMTELSRSSPDILQSIKNFASKDRNRLELGELQLAIALYKPPYTCDIIFEPTDTNIESAEIASIDLKLAELNDIKQNRDSLRSEFEKRIKTILLNTQFEVKESQVKLFQYVAENKYIVARETNDLTQAKDMTFSCKISRKST